MLTLSLTDYLADYPNRDVTSTIWAATSLRGRAHGPPLPARHAERGAAVVALPQGERLRGLQLIRPRAIEAAVALYGAERIVCGTDGTEFASTGPGSLAEAQIGEEAREQILHRNAAAMLARVAKSSQRASAAA